MKLKAPALEDLLDALAEILRTWYAFDTWVDERLETMRLALWYQVGEMAMIYGLRDLQWFAAHRMKWNPACFPPWVPEWRIDLYHRSWGPHERYDTRLLPGHEQPATPHVLEPRDPREVFRIVPIAIDPPELPPKPARFHAGDLLDPPAFVLSGLEGERVDLNCGDHEHAVCRSGPWPEDQVLHCRRRGRWFVFRFNARRWRAAQDSYGPIHGLEAPNRPDLAATKAPPGLGIARGP